ncbi:uncharacterized protein FOMMEDRAFT_26133 [Fomitiporia mediterranea MF3/22]|uniref:uncharacterized protein n=1 Tax=Fomitiporia mediterranea (strain MF3/22) TaxID=694068 RepID=UPI0004409690|nr:uncharacterized protein FOMMEDRAFT_26133 [Fomitiporia mediterranea MF3/22]EJD07006.1 hypothetical protein FOMMEDRAFT_26133 [Fomitiporia mediterranea MF3/22]
MLAIVNTLQRKGKMLSPALQLPLLWKQINCLVPFAGPGIQLQAQLLCLNTPHMPASFSPPMSGTTSDSGSLSDTGGGYSNNNFLSREDALVGVDARHSRSDNHGHRRNASSADLTPAFADFNTSTSFEDSFSLAAKPSIPATPYTPSFAALAGSYHNYPLGSDLGNEFPQPSTNPDTYTTGTEGHFGNIDISVCPPDFAADDYDPIEHPGPDSSFLFHLGPSGGLGMTSAGGGHQSSSVITLTLHQQQLVNIINAPRPYQCNGCKRTFARMDALNRHLRSDEGTECQAQQPILTLDTPNTPVASAGMQSNLAIRTETYGFIA